MRELVQDNPSQIEVLPKLSRRGIFGERSPVFVNAEDDSWANLLNLCVVPLVVPRGSRIRGLVRTGFI
jgi:hypothetical protein